MDDEFHRLLFQIAGRMQAYEMMRSITVHFDRVRSLAVTAVKEHLWMSDHRNICEAVAAHDQETARQLMEKHLNRYKVDETALREQYPQMCIRDRFWAVPVAWRRSFPFSWVFL